MSKKDTLTLKIGRGEDRRVVQLFHAATGEEIDLDSIMAIDYSNIYAEIVSVPTLMVNLGRLRSEAEAAQMRAKLKLKLVESELYEFHKKTLKSDTGKAPSIPAVNAAVHGDKKFYNASMSHINATRNFNDMDAIFWSLKSKDKKIDKIMESMKLSPAEFDKEILTDTFNQVIVKLTNK